MYYVTEDHLKDIFGDLAMPIRSAFLSVTIDRKTVEIWP